MSKKKAPMEINMDDCRMEFISSSGVRVCILDTFCKDFTPEKKEVVDAEIIRIYNNIMARCAAEGKLDAVQMAASE